MSSGITKVAMPKWGLSMTEGKVIGWLVDEGAVVAAGAEIVDIETEKIAGSIEAPAAGVLRRRIAAAGESIPVGGLVGVIADAEVLEEDVEAFVAEFHATFVPPEAGEDAASPTETLEVGGRSLRFSRVGEGDPPVVLLHGFGGDLNNWLFNQDALAQGRAVFALDLPGHGGSTKELGGFKDLVEALAGFLDGRGIERADLVGHSMGGVVALQFTLDHPDRASGLVLIDSAGLGEEIDGGYIQGFIDAAGRRELKDVLQRLFADPDLVTRRMVDDVLRYKRLDGVTGALRGLADDLFPGGTQAVVLRSRLGELSVPVLVVWGEADRIVPVEHARGLPEHIRVEVLPGVGHSPHMEAANDVNRVVGEFLGRAS